MAYDGTQFGGWLREQRKARDLTQRELAEQIGCSEFTLRKFEAGTRRPSRQIVERLTQFFDVSPTEAQKVMGWARFGGQGSGTSSGQRSDAAVLDAQTPANNLPSRLTRLIGRERELAAASGYLLRDGTEGMLRLLTLTGPPGVGKTRLAVQVASQLLGHCKDGVYFIGLALVRDARMLFAAIAQALGQRQPGSADALLEVAHSLRDKQMLLVLDNFEQVAQAGPDVVRLLELCPQLQVLVTSREALRVHGEQQFVVPTLSLPELTAPPSSGEFIKLTPGQLLDYASIALFMERATAVRPDFKLTPENSSDVVAICTRLDGLPLAIELAAARAKVLSPATMLARLERRLTLLTSGAHDLPIRHQTLRAAIAWSYEILTPQEQTLFVRLSVFAGGCDLEAVEAISQVEVRASILDLLKSLLDKSLLQQREGMGEEPRFYMLETIREFSMERLEESGEVEELRALHAKYYLSMAEEAEPHLNSQEQKSWLDSLEQDHDNMRAALDWALQRSEYELAGRIAGALRRFWDARGYWSEGRRWYESILAHRAALPATVGAKVTMGAGRLAYFQDDTLQAQALFEESLSLYRETNDKYGLADSLSGLAYLAARQGKRDVATALLEESLAASRELGDGHSVARTLGNLGRLAIEAGEYERAAALQIESLAMFRGLNDKWGMAVALEHLGQLAAEQTDYGRAISFLEESLALNQELGDKGHIAWVLGDLGIATLAAGDYERSKTTYGEASRLFIELGDKSGWAMALFMRGVALAYEGAYELGEASFRESVQVCLEIEDDAGCALGIDGLAFVASMDDPARAAHLAGMAENLRGEAGYRVQLIERPLHERTLATVSTLLNESDFTRALLEGRTTTFEKAISYALGSPVRVI